VGHLAVLSVHTSDALISIGYLSMLFDILSQGALVYKTTAGVILSNALRIILGTVYEQFKCNGAFSSIFGAIYICYLRWLFLVIYLYNFSVPLLSMFMH